MSAEMVVIPKSTHNVLRRLTGESRPDIALSMALKSLIHLRIEAVQANLAAYEKKYGMDFPAFEKAWQDGKIEDPYSYPVEMDYMEWEAAVSDLEELQDILKWQA
ncbi:MAG: hypothetical protein AB1846_15560 [Chloroflexota bacterium]